MFTLKRNIALTLAPLGAVVALACLAVPAARAHGDDGLLLEALTEELMKVPDADLFVRRGELFRHQGEWAKAEADFTAAARLDPQLVIVDYFRAHTRLEAGTPEQALPCIDRYVAAKPAEAEGWFMRGEVLAALGRPEAGAAEIAEGIRRSRHPRPEPYLRRAQLLASVPGADPARELAVLDEGIAQLGPVIALVDRAIALELACRNPAGALARIAVALETAPRREGWLVRQGDVLVQCGRTGEAATAYRAALAAIDELPERYRTTVPVEKLVRDARAALGRIAAPEVPK